VVIFLISQFILDPLNLYVKIWWLDIPLHFIGGIAVAFTAHVLLSEYEREGKFKASRLLRALFIIFFVAFVAVVWEWYEWVLIYLFKWPPNSWNDTLKDLAMGVLGAVIGAFTVVWE